MPSQHKRAPVSVRLPDAVRERLTARAARTGETIGKIISEAVAEKLEREDEMGISWALRSEQRQPGQCEFCRVAPSEGFSLGCQDPAGHSYCGHCRTCLLCGRYRAERRSESEVWGRQPTLNEIEAQSARIAAEDPGWAQAWALPEPPEDD